MKRFVCLLAALICVFSLSGCSGLFDKEYISIEDYRVTVQESNSEDENISVRTYSYLKQIIRTLVASGKTNGTVIFDSNYEGEAAADMASICREVRTQDALCAYCVNNISYELSHIVTYDEAKLHISYMQENMGNVKIYKLPYFTGVETLIRNTLNEGKTSL